MDDQPSLVEKREIDRTDEPEYPRSKRIDADVSSDNNPSDGQDQATIPEPAMSDDDDYHSCGDGDDESTIDAQEQPSSDHNMEISHHQDESVRGRVVIHVDGAANNILKASTEHDDEENDDSEASSNNKEGEGEENEEEEEDLFSSTFGKQADCGVSLSSEDESVDHRGKKKKGKQAASKSNKVDKVQKDMPIKQKLKERQMSRKNTTNTFASSGRSIKDISPTHQADTYDFVKSEHSDPCNPQAYRPTSPPLPSTPPPEESPKQTPTKQKIVTSAAAAAAPEFAPAIKEQHKFHIICKRMIPRLALPDHRYWIGILHIAKNPDRIGQEKDFMWLKGNRRTTVRTLRHLYAMTSARAEETVELLLESNGKVRLDESVEVLDLFGDKRVFFWAREKMKKKLLGRKLFANGGDGDEEVIEIEDD